MLVCLVLFKSLVLCQLCRVRKQHKCWHPWLEIDA